MLFYKKGEMKMIDIRLIRENPDEVKARIADIGVMYRHTVDGIRQYEQG